ncbi:hypothetical protein PF005_g14600 [Phytophthora fragariae]|uniref:Uncharacterized protein n=1 Tax=Phytophthora fragariae TaxID=53985 RepID=A0A6A3XJF1_9STRA|nr:hypothetical protein PF003_g11689 [Phytophthora fragariae]KAE8934854.1 hypothetical protein PF009_g15178 [Phytophthora fragariae]KAE9100237.1 hypothetical protein PF010_g14885 [Phytophthora fragariae]KAE9102087.1 hypothetical protein PF007_g14879 [Phytophthora fragariae]KAE9136320.1 hypothetical protein PF006_g14410 [Phytophthora fragariae]
MLINYEEMAADGTPESLSQFEVCRSKQRRICSSMTRGIFGCQSARVQDGAGRRGAPAMRNTPRRLGKVKENLGEGEVYMYWCLLQTETCTQYLRMKPTAFGLVSHEGLA